MKITLIKEVTASNPKLSMIMDLDEVKPSVQLTLKFTCPECAGHGCRKESSDFKCLNGTISEIIEPVSISKWFDDKTSSKIRMAITELYHEANGTKFQLRK